VSLNKQGTVCLWRQDPEYLTPKLSKLAISHVLPQVN